MREPGTGLRRHPDFVKLWVAQTVSLFGTQVTGLALPLTAVSILQATPFEMGLLRATHSAAAVLVGLFAGVVIDRRRRRPVLIGTDLAFAALAGSIPLAAAFGLLRIEQLYAVQFLSGAFSIFADVAGLAYLPSLVRRDQLVEANSKLQASASAANIGGAGLAGFLVQLLTAPIAIAVDAVSFLVSALFVWRIRAPEADAPPAAGRSVWAEIAEGLRFVFGDPVLRALSQGIALHFLFVLVISAVFVLFAVRELRIEPVPLGLLFAAFGPGFLLGAAVAGPLARRFGLGRTMVLATLLTAGAAALFPLAGGTMPATLGLLGAGNFLLALGIQVHGINLVSLRQALTPDRLQGRVNASFRVVNVCAMLAGALLGGALGEAIGLRATLAVGACGLFAHSVRLLASPVRALREQP